MAEASSTEYIELKRSVDLLELGMFICRLDCPWDDTDFASPGFQIKTLNELQALKEVCEYVYVRAKKQQWHVEQDNKPDVHTAAAERVVYTNEVPVHKELNYIRSAYKDACSQTAAILDSIRLSGELDIQSINRIIDDCMASILRNNSALIWLTQIRNTENYIAEHSLRVCIYAIALGRELGFSGSELQTIGICGLLHDIGKVRVAKDILMKQDILSAEESKIMQQHPLWGKQLLMTKAGISPEAIDVAYCHHERLDGSGYPRGISSERIPYYAKIIAILESYDAMIADRPNNKGMATLDACQLIYQYQGTLYDKTLLSHFTHFIGIYAPGSLVEMNTGEVGIVIETNENSIKPKILLILGSDKQEKYSRLIDLKKGDFTFINTLYSIKKSLPNGAYGIQIENYFDALNHKYASLKI